MLSEDIPLSSSPQRLISLMRTAVFIVVFLGLIFLNPSISDAQLIVDEGLDGIKFSRSLETLRDLEFQSWQVVAYRQNSKDSKVVLRIVGYPGKLRLEHPTDLNVNSGRRQWILSDITLANPKLANDGRQAAAEFDLSSLLEDLNKNRPLRLGLPGSFTELPVPPYLVGEWRGLLETTEKE